MNQNPDKARAAIARFTKMPLDTLKAMKISVSDPTMTAPQLEWWVGVMKKQNMLEETPDVKALLIP